MTTSSNLTLPTELILHVIDFLKPTHAVALRPNDPTAQCIRSLTRTCRATYPPALRLLYRHCLYIDSSERLRQLLVTLSGRLPGYSPADPHAEYGEVDIISVNTTAEENTPRKGPTLPEVDIIPWLQNLYLAPFPPATIDDLPTAEWIFELFCITRHTLRRLISAIPMHTLALWRDHLNVRSRLRAAFGELTAVEEFVSLYDDLDLLPDEQSWLSTASYHQPTTTVTPTTPVVNEVDLPVWLKWTRLRRLSLRKCNMYRPGYAQLERLPHLESVVMVASPCFEQEGWNKVFDNFTRGRARDVVFLWPACPQSSYFVDRFECHRNFLERIAYARAWNNRQRNDSASAGNGGGGGMIFGRKAVVKSRSKVTLRAVAVDEMYDPAEQRKGLLHLQTWIMHRAVEGTLFNVGESQRFQQSCLDPDYWVDDGWDRGRWNEELLDR